MQKITKKSQRQVKNMQKAIEKSENQSKSRPFRSKNLEKSDKKHEKQ